MMMFSMGKKCEAPMLSLRLVNLTENNEDDAKRKGDRRISEDNNQFYLNKHTMRGPCWMQHRPSISSD